MDGREAGGDGTTNRSMKAFQFGDIGNAKKVESSR